jgi:hypothetical protein
MAKAKTPSFSTEYALRMDPGQARTAAFRAGRKQVPFRAYALLAYAQPFRQSGLGAHLDALTVQQYAFDKQGRPRFKGKNPPPLGGGSCQEKEKSDDAPSTWQRWIVPAVGSGPSGIGQRRTRRVTLSKMSFWEKSEARGRSALGLG